MLMTVVQFWISSQAEINHLQLQSLACVGALRRLKWVYSPTNNDRRINQSPVCLSTDAPYILVIVLPCYRFSKEYIIRSRLNNQCHKFLRFPICSLFILRDCDRPHFVDTLAGHEHSSQTIRRFYFLGDNQVWGWPRISLMFPSTANISYLFISFRTQ